MEVDSCVGNIHAVIGTVVIIPLLIVLLAVEVQPFYLISLAIIPYKYFFVRLVGKIRLRFRTIAVMCPLCFIKNTPDVHVGS